MDHDARIGKRLALAGSAGAEEERSHGCGHSEANSLYVAWDELHRVVYGESGRDGSAGGIDVQRDVALGILVREVQQLRDQDVRDLVVDVGAEEQDSILEQAGYDVELSGPSLDGRDVGGRPRRLRRLGRRTVGIALRHHSRHGRCVEPEERRRRHDDGGGRCEEGTRRRDREGKEEETHRRESSRYLWYNNHSGALYYDRRAGEMKMVGLSAASREKKREKNAGRRFSPRRSRAISYHGYLW